MEFKINHVAKVLRQTLKDKGMTIKELAEKSGYSYSHIRSILKCRYTNIGLQALDDICQTVGLNMSDVIQTQEQSKPKSIR